jgi:hypothetical protein
MYYNTTDETGSDLKEFNEKNIKLETRITKLFMERMEWQPSEIYNYLMRVYPITSIRRALSDMTKEGKLTKTERMNAGMFGRREHVWRKV